MAAEIPQTEPPATAGRSDHAAWLELEGVIEELATAARTDAPADHFYHQLVSRCVQSMSALGGAVWLRQSDGSMRVAAQVKWPPPQQAADDLSRREHEQALARLIDGEATVLNLPGPLSADGDAESSAPQSVQLLLGKVTTAGEGHSPQSWAAPRVKPTGDRPVVAVVEIAQRGGASPATYKGQERFLAAVCEIASEYHAFRELSKLRDLEGYHRELFDLIRRAHSATSLQQVAYEIANEGARVVACDRLSVGVPRGRRCRLLAVSGVKRIQRRASAVRTLEQIATIAQRFNEPIYYDGDTSDAMPQLATLLEQYADESHVRQLVVVPVNAPTVDLSPQADANRLRKARSIPEAILIAEQFDAGGAESTRQRLTEVGHVSATAILQATRWDRLPLRSLLQPLGKIRDLLLPANLLKFVSAVVAIAAILYALLFVQSDFTVEAPGTLQPAIRSNVFASRSGLVDEIFVRHGQQVEATDPLILLRDADLDLELKRIRGEGETTARQLAAIQATMSGPAYTQGTPLEKSRLSAQKEELIQKQDNLRIQLEQLAQQKESLKITSPLNGTVTTWEVEQRLAARPVERGQVLLTVADLDANWQLELDVADDRIGHVLTQQDENPDPIDVEFRVASDERATFRGQISEIAQISQPDIKADADVTPTVRVTVEFDKHPLVAATQDTLYPGMTVRARIHCGQRSLGYVWLHDIWDTLVRWLTF